MKNNRIIRNITRRATYANVIASLALFIALSGVSYAAAKLPAKSVGSKQLKANSVTSAKLKNRTVTASDIKANTLTGNQVNEATLGTVAHATNADQAGSATNQAIAYVSVKSSASNDNPDVARAEATEIPLASNGPISIYGKCFTEPDATRTYYETYARTTVPGSVLIGYGIADEHEDNPAFNPGTPETDNQIQDAFALGGTVTYDYGESATALAPNGKGLAFDLLAWARSGSPTDPTKTLPDSDGCAFQLNGVKIN